jgi:hypothetical protein
MIALRCSLPTDDSCEEKSSRYVPPHPHRRGFNMSYDGRVEKIGYPTPKQTQKTVANPKSNRPLKNSCGKLKTSTPT